MKYVLYFLALLNCSLATGQTDKSFKNFTVEDGLSYSLVFEIVKDQHGFMWFGTTDGLNKFDGYEFTVYQNIPGDSTSLPDNSIWGLLEDSSGNLWIGTDGGGLSLFDREQERFISYKHDSNDPNSLIHNSVNTIIEDKNGSLWVGTYGGGISRQVSKGVFEHFVNDENDPASLSNNFVHQIYEDKEGRIWIGTKNGLNLFDPVSRSFKRITSENYGLKNNNVLSIAQDESGLLWLGTWGEGLNVYNPENDDFSYYTLDIDGGNRVAYVTVDSNHTIWAGFLGSGLISIDENGTMSSTINDQLNPSSIVNNNAWILYEDDLNNLWIGTESGISALSLNEKPIKAVGTYDLSLSLNNTVITGFDEDENGDHLLFSTEQEIAQYSDDGIQKLLEVPDIWSMLTSNENELWVSSYGYGVFRYSADYELIQNYLTPLNEHLENATYLYQDENSLVWIGTFGQGLFSYDAITEQFTHYSLLDSSQQESPPVLNMVGDNNNLWIGTYGDGLIKLDIEQGTLNRLDTKSKDPISHNTILSLYLDDTDVLWIGTDGGGLNRLDCKTGVVDLKTTHDGLPSNAILGILEDKNGNLWLSTNAGISKYDKLQSFTNYDQSHGLVSKGFNADAFYEDSSGRFYFGSGNGFNLFHPDSIRAASIVPPVFFNDFKVLNKSVSLSDELLDKHINLTESITLTHLQNFFTLNFSALEYFTPEKITYAYQLEGFSPDWIYTDASNRQATFTNLDHGTYTLHVKASNSDGVWGDNTKSIALNILPPPWKTWWAYSLYGVALVILSLVIIRTITIRQRLKSSLKLEQLERKKVEEMDHLKSRFFAGISHEFRTPLTLISSPVEQLIRTFKTNKEVRHSLELVKRNADRLLRQINQLLDLSKVEAGKLRLQVSKSDIINWIRVTASSFESLATNADIDFSMTLPKDPIVTFYDKNKVEQILINLLSNAFKFTKAGGNVRLNVTSDEDNISIEVANEGPEIPQKYRDKIFDRFFQLEESKSAVEGSGIGLALVKEFAELHHGMVTMGREDTFTVFRLTLPISDTAYQQDDRVTIEETEVFKAIQQQDEENEGLTPHPDNLEEFPTVLIVEDNFDLRSYMASQLVKAFQVIDAVDGRKGLEMANSQIPDLIITDLMMPEMDGIEMLQAIRDDPKTNHIPIIMLTAKAEKESRLEGLEKGADHYLNKPFDVEELVVRARSLLNQRRRIREHYYSEFLINPKAEKVPSMDDRFLEEAVAVFERQLSNHEFSVDQFAKELAMSRVQLHRKMKAIVGCSASEFMRHYRLKKAYNLLKNKADTVSQIAYSVGFNNLSYFTKAFKEVYHQNPSEV